MGNDNTAQPAFPAAYPSVIAVAATDSADKRASFSNMGAHIDVSAPGVGIESTYWDDTFASLNGTSMASPHVAGVAALILSRNPSLSAAQVGDIIRSTAKPLRDNPPDPVPNNNYGHGLVQARAAVFKALPLTQKTLQVGCSKVSLLIVCGPSRPIATCKSEIVCPVSVPVSCQSRQILCQVSVQILCDPSTQILCQLTRAGCPPPVSLADCPSLPCPNSLACGNSVRCGPPPLGPGVVQGWDAYDPYDYDPYGGQYGDQEE
jgi:hypothetical protein